MTESLERDEHSQNLRCKAIGDDMGHEILFTRLEDIPIENARHEKVVFERGEDARKLNPEHCPGPVIVSSEIRSRRVVEVYRRCFEEGARDDRLKVVSDFIAHFPQQAFDADWLKELLRQPVMSPGLGDDTREQVLGAFANGFRRAARGSKESAIQKSYRISGTRIAAQTLQDELSRWNDGLERHLSTPEEVAARAAEKADEIVKRSWKLGRREKQRLTTLLECGKCYKAAILIASKLFGVRERDLQTKTD